MSLFHNQIYTTMKILIQKFESLIQLTNQILLLIGQNQNTRNAEEPAVYLSVGEAAYECKVNIRTFYRWVEAGLICPTRIGGSQFFEKQALARLVKENKLNTKRIPCGC